MIEPIIRSRTNLFLSYRESASRSTRFTLSRPTADTYGGRNDVDDDEREGLITSAAGERSHVAVEIDALPPKWVDLSDQVEEILQGAATKIAALDKLHAKHVLPGFVDRSAEEREIEALSSDITRDFRRCQALIQRITASEASHTFPPSSAGRQQDRTALNVQRGLAAKVQDLSGTFRKKQRVYMQKLQGHAIKNQDLLVASGAVSLRGAESITAVEDDLQASNSQLSGTSQLQQTVAAPNLDVATRDREVTELAKSITSLAELFKDLAVLVIDQGTILDSVEYNIEQTAVHVQEAVKELDVAQKYQRNTGRRKCIIFLLLLIVGLILILIFKPRRQSVPATLEPIPSSIPNIPVFAARSDNVVYPLRRRPLRDAVFFIP